MTRLLGIAALASLFAGCTGTTPNDTSTDTSDTSDTGTWYTGPWQIATATEACDSTPTPHVWHYDVQTDGLAGQIEIDIAETGDCNWLQYEAGAVLSPKCDAANTAAGHTVNDPTAIWDETDLMDQNPEWDSAQGSWDHWKMDLSVVTDYHDVVSADPAHPNQGTTLWDCALDNATDIGTGGQVDWANGSLAWMVTMYDDSSPPVKQDCIIFGYQSTQYWKTYKGHTDCLCFEGDGSDSYCEN